MDCSPKYVDCYHNRKNEENISANDRNEMIGSYLGNNVALVSDKFLTKENVPERKYGLVDLKGGVDCETRLHETKLDVFDECLKISFTDTSIFDGDSSGKNVRELDDIEEVQIKFDDDEYKTCEDVMILVLAEDDLSGDKKHPKKYDSVDSKIHPKTVDLKPKIYIYAGNTQVPSEEFTRNIGKNIIDNYSSEITMANATVGRLNRNLEMRAKRLRKKAVREIENSGDNTEKMVVLFKEYAETQEIVEDLKSALMLKRNELEYLKDNAFEIDAHRVLIEEDLKKFQYEFNEYKAILLNSLTELYDSVRTVIDVVDEEVTMCYRNHKQWWKLIGRGKVFRRFAHFAQIRVELRRTSQKISEEIKYLDQYELSQH